MPQKKKRSSRITANTRSLNTQKKLVLFILITTITILIAIFIANGSEKQDAWLYIISIWIVIMGAIEAFSRKSK